MSVKKLLCHKVNGTLYCYLLLCKIADGPDKLCLWIRLVLLNAFSNSCFLLHYRENLEAQSSKYWHCQVQCFTIMCYYTPHSDPFLLHDKISMLPLELMEIPGFLPVFFSKCLLLISVHITLYSLGIRWSLCPWTAGNRSEVRQEMTE